MAQVFLSRLFNLEVSLYCRCQWPVKAVPVGTSSLPTAGHSPEVPPRQREGFVAVQNECARSGRATWLPWSWRNGHVLLPR